MTVTKLEITIFHDGEVNDLADELIQFLVEGNDSFLYFFSPEDRDFGPDEQIVGPMGYEGPFITGIRVDII